MMDRPRPSEQCRIGGIWAGFDDEVRSKIMNRVRQGESFEKEVEREFKKELARFEERVEILEEDNRNRIGIRVMHPKGLSPEDVEETVVNLDSWFALPATSVPGGAGPPVWKSGWFGIFSSEWSDTEAHQYAQSWDDDLSWIEVPDAFVEQYGIR